MAVSLNQFHQQPSRPRSSTVPSSMGGYQQSGPVPMPAPDYYQQPYPADARRSHCLSTAPTSAPIDYQQSLYYQRPVFHQPSNMPPAPAHYGEIAPALPPRTYLQQPPSPQGSQHSTSSSLGTQSTGRTSLEPDPLPPHSNPQALTQTQSEAFTGSKPVPPVHIGTDDVWNSTTGLAEFRISREAAHMPSFVSTKPLITVTRVSSFIPIGSVRFHTISSNKIDLTINGHSTSISHTGRLHLHNRWGFRSTTTPNSDDTWFWRKDRSTGGARLEDAKKHGQCLARMKGDLLTFEKARLSQDAYDEILISAIAMAEAARRQKRKSDIVDIASAIGDFTSSDGSAGGAEGVGTKP